MTPSLRVLALTTALLSVPPFVAAQDAPARHDHYRSYAPADFAR